MKVTLPEKKFIKTKHLIIYMSIMIICIISVIIAFYIQFYARVDILGIKGDSLLGKKSIEEKEVIKSEFDKIFTNSVIDESNSDNKKKDKNELLVYTNYEKKESKLNSYDVEVHIPQINIENEIIDKYNKEIEEIFKTKTENVLSSENKNIIYSVEYVANVKDDILSLMIRSNLKEGPSAQRVIIQTYNYDLRNNKEITLEEIIRIEKIDSSYVEEEINNTIKDEQKKVEDLKELGYNIYSRDTNKEMYTLENSTEFYLSGNILYIVYAYGNQSNTSEMDLIII